MMRDSLVAINIIENVDNKNILLQENTTPILFYWNGEGTIKDSLVKDKFFVNKIIPKTAEKSVNKKCMK